MLFFGCGFCMNFICEFDILGLFKGDVMFLVEILLLDFDFFEIVNGIFEEKKIIRNGRKIG